MGNLSSIQNIYDYENNQFREDHLTEHIYKFESFYGRFPLLISILKQMLQIEDSQRFDFERIQKALIEWDELENSFFIEEQFCTPIFEQTDFQPRINFGNNDLQQHQKRTSNISHFQKEVNTIQPFSISNKEFESSHYDSKIRNPLLKNIDKEMILQESSKRHSNIDMSYYLTSNHRHSQISYQKNVPSIWNNKPTESLQKNNQIKILSSRKLDEIDKISKNIKLTLMSKKINNTLKRFSQPHNNYSKNIPNNNVNRFKYRYSEQNNSPIISNPNTITYTNTNIINSTSRNIHTTSRYNRLSHQPVKENTIAQPRQMSSYKNIPISYFNSRPRNMFQKNRSEKDIHKTIATKIKNPLYKQMTLSNSLECSHQNYNKFKDPAQNSLKSNILNKINSVFTDIPNRNNLIHSPKKKVNKVYLKMQQPIKSEYSKNQNSQISHRRVSQNIISSKVSRKVIVKSKRSQEPIFQNETNISALNEQQSIGRISNNSVLPNRNKSEIIRSKFPNRSKSEIPIKKQNPVKISHQSIYKKKIVIKLDNKPPPLSQRNLSFKNSSSRLSSSKKKIRIFDHDDDNNDHEIESNKENRIIRKRLMNQPSSVFSSKTSGFIKQKRLSTSKFRQNQIRRKSTSNKKEKRKSSIKVSFENKSLTRSQITKPPIIKKIQNQIIPNRMESIKKKCYSSHKKTNMLRSDKVSSIQMKIESEKNDKENIESEDSIICEINSFDKPHNDERKSDITEISHKWTYLVEKKNDFNEQLDNLKLIDLKEISSPNESFSFEQSQNLNSIKFQEALQSFVKNHPF